MAVVGSWRQKDAASGLGALRNQMWNASEIRSTKNTLDQLRLVILKIRHFDISNRPRH